MTTPNPNPPVPPATPNTVPWVALLTILFLALILQVGLVSVGGTGTRQLSGGSEEALVAAPSPMASVRSFLETASPVLLLCQLLANALAFLFTVVVGRRNPGRAMSRSVFLGIAVLGGLAGVAQGVVSPYAGAATLASAAGSLIAWRILKQP
ncbi:hypothetical protein [Cystobacter ferrugineus]|uniref:Uncharacterized protein n=1 Tax=Cystobacter ferrugineus TaxID=83449 RepID=A0A1L9AUS0_9BACT|nr:hypothetical protein [Cystobacter ferrugineus]OJH33736.1 hypothetical protein BON30_47260 [Cystobacter ferrugineus]